MARNTETSEQEERIKQTQQVAAAQQAQKTAGERPLVTAGKPVVPGGAPGMPRSGVMAETRIGGGQQTGSALGLRDPSDAALNVLPLKKFRVTVGGWIVVDGQRHAMRPGKEIDENMYDLVMLRRSGIRYEEIKEDDPRDLGEVPLDPPVHAAGG